MNTYIFIDSNIAVIIKQLPGESENSYNFRVAKIVTDYQEGFKSHNINLFQVAVNTEVE